MTDLELKRKFFDHCSKMERRDRILFCYKTAKDLNCSDGNIDLLSILIDIEWNYERKDNPPYDDYFNNLRQTKEKQLAPLLSNKNKKNIRVDLFNEVQRQFLKDMEEEMLRKGIDY